MSSSTVKTSCSACDCKGIGIFKCEGCGQIFCRKHANEHRNLLSHELDEIVLQYDNLQQTIAENNDKSYHHPLLQQIKKWEEESIEKIRQTAHEARKKLNILTSSSTGTVSKELQTLGKRLRKAREDDDYIETDLQVWINKLDELRNDVLVSTARIYEDSSKVFVSEIYVSMMNSVLPSKERFEEFHGTISIENNGQVAIYNGSNETSDAYVRGMTKYTIGKHQIHFRIDKTKALYVMSFSIVSAATLISDKRINNTYHRYGWATDDFLMFPRSDQQPKKNFQDFRGETTFELSLTIDCDNFKISYFNERTRKTHRMTVNTTLCPLPWQLEFYLFCSGDRVELLSSTEIS